MARILITSGPTREPLDPVRFLTNASTGRMGAALAAAALERGHAVDFVTGPAAVFPPKGVHKVAVTTALEMLGACEKLYPLCDAVIGAAAVSDFRPRSPLAHKKPQGGGAWAIELIPNPDILEALGRLKRHQVHAGFALETLGLSEAIQRARDKLSRKNLDWIVLNSAQAIGAEEGIFLLIPRQGPEISLGKISKEKLAGTLLDRIFPKKP
ncbi:MAG: phosphopantothenoylcysteine decarboxylase [Planctomycetes bacterium]|nr:phosphopantothenoylcysteine decarboxylase [Planctomycetota bacterium]